ncbi:fatty acyl-AMP ligase [Haliscomenobacter sp.]|uniref:fatty acyl-AMP ligase n=1 Tax=Haliscomenobacter sp. TaxID=2717303 RepID=UPI003BAC3E17
MKQAPISLIDVLSRRAKEQPDKLVYRFLVDGEYDEVALNYADLDRRARSIGALLQSCTKPGDRALLLFPPGIDFIVAFWGCLYAGVMAVPAYPPHPVRLEKSLPIILRIVADARPSVALLTSTLSAAISSRNEILAEFGKMKLLTTDTAEPGAWAEQWEMPEIGASDVAFIQYTSGSTSIPKGVVLSHNNLIHNMRLIEQCFGTREETQGVLWLPPYHDMGLIGGILQPVYTGALAILMPPMLFLQRPFRWLEAISRFRATVNGAPNFAYDLCVRKIKPEQRELLDLSHWEVAFNGAEPVYHKTLAQFADYFAPCGFRPEAFLPCYGVAEATLLVSGGPKSKLPTQLTLLNSGLEQNLVIPSTGNHEGSRTLVSCGQTLSDQQICIVNPETLEACPADEIGEIWLSGPCVASGYWDKPLETTETFEARLANSGEGPFLRTGDLGFLKNGELYVTGRIKNLVISGGKNHYAHDLERTVEDAHPAIWPAGSAVFSISNDGPERIIVVAEVNAKLFEKEELVIKAIREAIAKYHDLHVDDIQLIPPGGIPKTTSGKTRHFLCRQSYLDGTLKKFSLI